MTDFTVHPTMKDKKTDTLSINLNLLHQKGSPISPPTPLSSSSTNSFSFNNPTSPSYSLFDTSDNNASTNSPWDWFSSSSPSTPLYRKHSINADGNDFSSATLPNSSSYGSSLLSNNNSTYWRRASEPNSKAVSSQACTFCLNKHTQMFTPSCGQHQFCHSCSTSQSLNLLMQGICPRCAQTQTFTNSYSMHLATKPNNTISTIDTMFQQYQQQSVSLSTTPQVMTRSFSSTMSHYPCIKLSNIPWDISQNDVRHFFGNCRSPSLSAYTQSIHIMMDRTTGKTLSDAYVEFSSVADMKKAIETRNQKPLKGRIVSVNECSQEELLSVIFPKWRGQFRGTLAIPPASEVVKTMSTAAGGGNSGCPPFITREEINSLLVVCKNYKLHFSRKCAERPFENIISVIAKYPWNQTHLISTMHRDHVYEMLKLSIESLKTHLSKDYVQIDSTLLERLTRAGIMCPAFTERQKTTLLQTARIECPADIDSFLNSSNNSNATPPGLSYNSPLASPCLVDLNQSTNVKPQPFYLQQSQEYFFNTEYNDDSGNEDDDLNDLLLSPNDSPISSLMRDIQQNCYIDEKSETQKSRKPSLKSEQLMNNGTPLLLQAIPTLSKQIFEQTYRDKQSSFNKPIRQLSPWATSYTPKASSVDIWRMPTSVESHHRTSNNLLTA